MVRRTAMLLVCALASLCVAALLGSGLVLYFVLPPGSTLQIREYHARSMSVFGMTRCDWRDLHFYLAMAATALVVLHVVLHWKVFRALMRHAVPSGLIRNATVTFLLALCGFLALFPLFAKPEAVDLGQRCRIGSSHQAAGKGPAWQRLQNRPELREEGGGLHGTAPTTYRLRNRRRQGWQFAENPGLLSRHTDSIMSAN